MSIGSRLLEIVYKKFLEVLGCLCAFPGLQKYFLPLAVLGSWPFSKPPAMLAVEGVSVYKCDGGLPSSGPYLLSGASGMHLWEGLRGSEPEYIPLPHRYGRPQHHIKRTNLCILSLLTNLTRI
ncbi:hypothetical protein HELRODRAFT_184735 [Helobdella robusta]|uniref:Uncharacterized protein n=1 Tax=Helobdella robusta TaxID=6412 RepID=T1FLW2_HELRO|nr:hypothetical protein HELRODRAFT_184735 [Helobdella robusta]ESO01470.1 hypothetical protein HELRODRAFT_184735 [Helobdella robusta]